MAKTMYRVSIMLMILGVFYSFQPAHAQIDPTNTATISGSVSDVAGKPVINAKVSLSGPSGPKSTSTQTDAQGLFVFVGVPFGTYQISAATEGLGTATRSINIEDDTNVAIQYQPLIGALKVIARVSSTANAAFNVTPASVTQVNPIANAFEGQTSWRTILEQIPGIAQGGLNNGSNVDASMPDGLLTPMKISINGALPYETATLLDNMPLIGGSFEVDGGAGTGADLSAYPLNGFDSADVVRGPGANAPSIVDSIGGSFVLHSPGVVSSNHYNFSLSTDPYGGIVANALAAVHWKKLSATMTYGLNDSPGPITGEGVTAPTLFDPITVNGQSFSTYSPPCSSPCQFGQFLVNPNFAGFTCYGFQVGLLTGGINQSMAWSQHSGSVGLNYAFSPSMNVVLFYAGQMSNMPDSFPYYTVNFIPPAGYAGGITPGQHLFTQDNYALTFPQMLLQQGSSLLEEKIITQFGHGVLTLAALQNRTFVTISDASITSGTVQLYGGGTLNGTATVFNGGTYNVTYPIFTEYAAGWNNNRDLLLSYATPLGENSHAGVSFVKSYYNTPYQHFCDYAGVYFDNSATPSAISQTTNELRVFVGGNPSEKMSLDLSTYFVNANYHVGAATNTTTYSDVRYSYTAPRLGFVWRPTASVAVRAAAGGGFAEAPLGDLIGSNGMPQINSASSPAYYTVLSQNYSLQPEKSFAFDFGTDIRLHRDTIFSFDVYRSNVYGQVYLATLANGRYSGAYGTLPLYTAEYGNIGTSRYEGVLVDLRHDTPHGIYWSFSGGLTRAYVVSIPAGFYDDPSQPCTMCANLYIVPGANFNGELNSVGVAVPYAQSLGKLGYRWSPDKYVDMIGTYYGNNNTYFRPAFVILSGHIGYPVTKNISLLATFRNINGVYDNPIQTFSLANLSGASSVSGLPYPLYGEEYGPRTVILTTVIHL